MTNILAASLYQSQKHVSLDGHVYSLHAYLMSDRFFNRLGKEEQAAVLQGAEIAKVIHRGMTTAQDANAETILKEKGMTVTRLYLRPDRRLPAALPGPRSRVAGEGDRPRVDR